MRLRILPPDEMLEATVELPLSKSMSVRAAAMDAMGAAYDAPLAACDDVEAMRRVAAARGGVADAGDSGAALRFGLAILAATPGADVVLTGSPRLMQRPVGALVDALHRLGAQIEATGAGLHVCGRHLAGGSVEVDASASSQFVSALLMAAPLMENGIALTIDWNQPSLPYIDMTLSMMRNRGIHAVREGVEICVVPGKYSAPDAPDVERDWSAAAFWYEIAALSAGFITLPGLTDKSLQGDRAVADIFTRLGVVTTFTDEGAELCADPEMHARLDLDCSPTPDMVPALAFSAALLGMPFELSGVEALRHKECDRLEAITAQLSRIGVVAEIDRGTLQWDGRRMPVMDLPVFDSCSDHRMAMAEAPVALFAPGIIVDGAECVAKSYPEFWNHLAAAGFSVEEPDGE